MSTRASLPSQISPLAIASLVLLVANQVVATTTVTLKLDSSYAGLVVQPSTAIDWTISFQDSTGDNLGLALISVDLLQNPSNPGVFVLSPGTTIPSPLSGFARPSGFSSPPVASGSTPAGFGGTARGTNCEKNLYRIGGGQNTFAVAGTNVGADTTVDSGVGQSGWQTLTAGSFAAPDVRGVYVVTLDSAVANVLTTINSGSASVVAQADIAYSPMTFSFIVCPGDVQGDGDVDLNDLTALMSSYGLCSGQSGYNAAADFTGDGCVGINDLTYLLANFGSVCN